jgi:hypothetical protein
MTLDEAREILEQKLPSLDAAAQPTKSEVFVESGRNARRLHEAIEVVLAALPARKLADQVTGGQGVSHHQV